jgi:hypothetical protein
MDCKIRRGAADEALRTFFGPEYNQLTDRQRQLIITDVIALDENERIGSLYRATRHLGAIANRGLPRYVRDLEDSYDSSLSVDPDVERATTGEPIGVEIDFDPDPHTG